MQVSNSDLSFIGTDHICSPLELFDGAPLGTFALLKSGNLNSAEWQISLDEISELQFRMEMTYTDVLIIYQFQIFPYFFCCRNDPRLPTVCGSIEPNIQGMIHASSASHVRSSWLALEVGLVPSAWPTIPSLSQIFCKSQLW